MTTSTALAPSVSSTSRTEARIVAVRSLAISILIAGEIEVASWGRRAITRSIDLDDVRIGLLEDEDQDGALPVGPAGHAVVLDVVVDARDVAELRGRRRRSAR